MFDNFSISVQAKYQQRLFHLALWDTMVHDDGWKLLPLYFPETSVFVLCYAVNWPASLTALDVQYLPVIQHYYSSHHIGHAPPIILVGLKDDLRSDSTCANALVSREVVETIAKKLGAVGAFRASALAYSNKMLHLPSHIVRSKSHHTPAGGVELLFQAIVKAAIISNTNKTNKQSLLSRIFGRISNSRVVRRGTNEELDQAIAVLMCRHPRLGKNCPEAMRQLPDDVWLGVFRWFDPDSHVEFLPS
eukprot:c19954_g1_i4.p1 GENE.c19954_g1_i4~~c19954_g1_i4.p1  ORF type:complete len:247 (+),score=56.48 c19954_g1_i4:208-948(+)